MDKRIVGIVFSTVLYTIAAEIIILTCFSGSILKRVREINIPICAKSEAGDPDLDGPHQFALVKEAYDRYLEEHRELPVDLSFIPETLRNRIDKADSHLWYSKGDGILYYRRSFGIPILYPLVILRDHAEPDGQ